MKLRLLGSSLVFILLVGGINLAHGGGAPEGPSSKSALLKRAAIAPRLLTAARPHPTAAFVQSMQEATGPSAVNFLTAGIYQNNPHPNNGGIADVVFGDFNGDGKQDILTVDGSACISVLPGDGKGHFSGTPIDSCIFPVRDIYYVVAGDFNNDGIPDVAVVSDSCCNPNSIYVMFAKGNGDGTFTYVNDVSYSWNGGNGQLGYGETAKSLIAADLNHDGNLDLVMTTTGGGPNGDAIYVFLGDGKFDFTQSLSQIGTLGTCSYTNDAVVADFNHDGIPDLAVTNTNCGLHEIDILLGKGDGTFQTLTNYRFPSDTGNPSDIATGDFNGDGNIDLVVIEGAGGNPITSFLGNGDGTFGSPHDSTSVYNPDYLAVGDFNGDGKDDVIVSSDYGSGEFDGVQLSNGDGTFAYPVNYSVLAAPTRLFVADLNGDGRLDWVSLSNGSEYFCVGLGSGTGGFLAAVDTNTTPGSFGSGAVSGIVAADFNHDGHLDYATVGSDRYYPGVNISVGDGSGDFAAPVHYSAGSNPAEITAGDFNHDGYPDIAVLDQSDGMVTVLLNQKNGTFASGVSYAVGAGGGYIQTADFNRDGNPDLIVTNGSDGTVSVLLGNGDGTFQAQKVSTAQSNASYLTVADFNGDGTPDVAITNYNGPNISILLGNGDGTFQSPTSFASELQIACGIAAGDFNNDGKVDLAVCGQLINNGTGGDGGVSIFLANGGGSFQAPVNYPTVPVGLNGNPVTFGIPRVGDLNNDGNLDIVVPNTNAYTDGVNLGPAILMGKGDGTFMLNPAHAPITGAIQLDIAMGDFNNDGFLDIAVLNADGVGDPFASTVTLLLSTSGTEVVLTSSPNPSTQGQSITFTATVETSLIGLPTPTGTITFELGSIDAPIALVNGVATYTTSALPLGNTTGFAAYSGDTNFIASTSLGLLQVVKPAPLVITTTGLPDAVQNVSYTGSVAADGGIGPYTFTTSSGTLPAGLTLNSNGSISGTPTGLPGTSSFTVQAQDSESPAMTAIANLSIIVASNLKITTTSLPNGVVGNSYSANLAASGGIPAYTFTTTSGSLPGGLSLSAGGVISGTPTGSAGTSNFTVQVQDSATPAQMATANLSITLTGALAITTTSLPNGVQNTPYGASVAAAGGVGPYSFSITSGAPPSGITMNASGVFSGSSPVVGTANFTVQAKDSSTPAQTATASLSITIASTLTITTGGLPNGVVNDSYSATVMASGGIPSYTFTVSSGALPAGLLLNSSTGAISGSPSAAGTSNFTVQVKDANTPADTATANLSITVTGALAITTTSLPNGVQNTSYGASVAATGGVGPYSFSITSGAPPSGITMNANGVFSGSSSVVGTANFTVQAKDSSTPAQTATANLSITIASTLSITTGGLSNGVVNDSYSATLMASGGIPAYTFTVNSGNLPAGLSLSASGTISGTPSAAGTSNFTVQVKDSNTPADTATANLSITVTGALTITTTSLPNGVQNTSYGASVAATGGVGPYSFSITSGAPPSGITMNANGVFSGSSSVVGTANFTVQAKDSSTPAQMATVSLSITITSNLTITTSSLPNGVVGNPYSASVTAGGGNSPYTFSIASGSLPAGLALASGTGVISGTPSAAGTANFTVQVKDSSSTPQAATANLTIKITGDLTITTTSLPSGFVGAAYNAEITVFGGNQPYTFSLAPGFAMPEGLSLSTSGAITGTPSFAGTSSFTVQVTDSSSPMQTAKARLSLIIVNPLAITTTSLPTTTDGSNYSARLTAKGGVPPYTFSFTGGQTPFESFSISPNGTITGTDAQGSGDFEIDFAVLDSATPPNSASAAVVIAVVSPLTITTTSLPGGSVGTPYSASIGATGGSGSYAFSIRGGTLPAGLSMSANGAITGTPTAGGTSTFTVEVTDTSNPPLHATAKLSITIANPLTITTASLPNPTAGSRYSEKILATGGKTPYTFSLTSGTLPFGLTLSPNGVISGTPTQPFQRVTFTVTVTDSSDPVQVASATFTITVNQFGAPPAVTKGASSPAP
jgi:hypothetical protein